MLNPRTISLRRLGRSILGSEDEETVFLQKEENHMTLS